MRLVLGMMKHETNTFSPLRTDWARFQAWGAFTGEEARKNFEKTAMPLGAYMKLARERGADFTIPMAAEAMPSGPVERDAYERMAGAICEAVAKGCDGVLLDLHGAMVTVDHEDGEGELLARIRKIAPDVPIAVTLDLHTNLTQRMVDNCTALIGYKTYPHVDMYEVAEQVGRIVLDSMAGKCRPVMAWRSLPLLSQTLRQGTDDEPMKSLIAMTRAAEAKPGVLAASVFGGFPMADIRDAGTSVITVTDGDAAQAQAVCDEIGAAAWKARESFIYQHEPLEQAVARAKTLTEGPVLLLDHADNTGSGGTQDVMTVIAEVMRQGLEDVAVAAVWDSAAVQEMARAGVGATVTIRLGGKTDMPSIDLKGEPLEITGKVKTLTDGEWVVHGPMYTGVTVQMGPTAVLDTGKVQIVIVSRHHEPWDTGVFRSVGIEPEHKRYLVLKSRIHYRAGFAGLGKATITCDGHGVTTSDNSILTFTRLRRPIYPLDRMNDDTLLPSTAQQ
ncbi:M81 family metallopeptidase [Oceanibaculum nanhaiense]|uniref:M81 family metallopeptidase n=1 Tax=Oceanibaculum nanhaiense TaxID=1909734 RepID=UPI000A393032|nr:M81 family metallopeptidase [Oceanibaculum nanhaiense]